MSGYILCQTKKAGKPYFVENISTNIYSLEELCYYLYHNLYLVDSSVMNEAETIKVIAEKMSEFQFHNLNRLKSAIGF